MLGQYPVGATVGVREIKRARAFYEDVLELSVQHEEGGEAVTYGAGQGSALFVYQSAFAGGNRATAATWAVDDVEAEVRRLVARGVVFEHYDDMPGCTRQGDVHHCGPMRLAWFKDPDGNIHGLAGRAPAS